MRRNLELVNCFNAVIEAPKRTVVVAEAPKTFYQLVESKDETRALNKSRLKGFLGYYGEYPIQYRF
jgi:hypothetical protein